METISLDGLKIAYFLIGHGSRSTEGLEEFRQLVKMVGAAAQTSAPPKFLPLMEYGFLEFARPTLEEGLGRCVEQGANAIVLLPVMLTKAGHVLEDIPAEMEAARLRFPQLQFHLAAHLQLHPRILELCQLRIEEAENRSRLWDRKDSVLLVVGRGSSVPEACEDVLFLGKTLQKRMGWGQQKAGFLDIASPSFSEALESCFAMGLGRIIVLSFLLFTGVLEKKVRHILGEYAARCPQTEVLYAGHLGPHSLLMTTILARAQEALPLFTV